MALFSEYRFKCLSRKHVMHVFHTVLTLAVTLALFIYDTGGFVYIAHTQTDYTDIFTYN